MKRALLLILFISLFQPSNLISQDESIERRLSLTGYGLIKESVELSFIKKDLIEARRKIISLDDSGGLKLCHITRIIENIAMAEIICRYEGLILGTLNYLQDKHRLEQYKVHKNRLKEYTLQNLYARYKATLSTNANLEDKVIIDLADKALKEMVTAAELVEEVIQTLPSQS